MKKRTKKIFAKLKELGFHPTDIEYLNGYFIFEYGKDMVVHFHLKECKGWKFGIWWREVEKEAQKKNHRFNYDFFAQYEENIDKFKPSASVLVEEDVGFEEKSDDVLGYDMEKICKFIKNHPLRAWYADRSFGKDVWDTPPSFLLFKFVKEQWFDNLYIEWRRNRIDKKYLKLLKAACEETLVGYKIMDGNHDGWQSYPRWHITAKNFKENPVDTRGWYDFPLENVSSRLLKKAKRFDEKWQKSDFLLCEDCEPFERLGVFVNDKKLKERKREEQ